mmetsp:Transcript_25551/g.59271  ORF Transcript_25551/g.59271 Transcript_25551/m.59271 type:complete len:89 (-) Transcript_25551:241-507(-)
MKTWKDKKVRKTKMSPREKRAFMQEMQFTFAMLFAAVTITALLVTSFITVDWREYPLFDRQDKLRTFTNWTAETLQATGLKGRVNIET